MHKATTQRHSNKVSPIDRPVSCSEPQQTSVLSDESQEDPAVSVLTHLVSREHEETPTQKAHSSDSEPPSEFGTLQRKWAHSWGSASLDVLGALASLFFLVIAALSLSLNGDPLSGYGQNIKAITLVSPTIFPIVYAAILGKLLRRLGLFKAERGSTIGSLEQLIGSQSVFSSIERQFGLRKMDLLGATIIAGWMLSPLGGQASLRLLSTQLSEQEVEATVHYHIVETFKISTMLLDYHMEEFNWICYAPLFMSTLQFARQNFNQSRDLFGNIRIPDMESLKLEKDVPKFEWYNVTDAPSLSYTSLLGHPIVGVPTSGNFTFVVESSYWEVRCGSFSEIQGFPSNKSNPEDSWKLGPELMGPSFDLVYRNNYDGDNNAQYFKYVTKLGVNETRSSNCTATLRIVESSVACQKGICAVERMRTSNRSDSTLAALMPWNPDSYRPLFTMLCTFLPSVDKGPRPLQWNSVSSLVEQWIWDPSLLNILPGDGHFRSVDTTSLRPEIFTERLQIAFNTFWESTLGFNYMAVNATAQLHDYDDTIDTPWTAIRAQGTDLDTERYVCNITFAIITIVISLLLFAAAVTSAFLGSITKAPDILGYVSTLARDDPYFEKAVPSYHSGLEAARALRDVRVMIGDVRSDHEVGHIASAASKEIDTERVSRKRVYD